MSEFANVLRAWRDRVSPASVGLPSGPGRRAPGLRREELAALAGVSVDYIVRLEQGRAEHPSPQLLHALARALRLDPAERDHLFRVAGMAPPARELVPRYITPGVQRIVDRLGDVPLAVFTATHDILRWNPLWAALIGDPSGYTGFDRNFVWRHFLYGAPGIHYDPEHGEEYADDLVADLRTALGRYPQDADLAQLIARLRDRSPDFERRWASAHLAQHRASRKVVDTSAGPIAVDCDVLAVPDSDLRLVVYTTVPGTDDAARMDLLRVTGIETFSDAR